MIKKSPYFSIIIPARNEEKNLVKCIEALTLKQKNIDPSDIEIIVIDNRSTDNTVLVAKSLGAKVVYSEAKNLSIIRNTGAKVATGDVIITIDADSFASPNLLLKVRSIMESERFIGGGALILPERISLGIIVTGFFVGILFLIHRISVGVFFCRREDFFNIGGFNEDLTSVEDIDFAKRLKKFGRRKNRNFKNLLTAHIITSCRKFDKLGDWYFIRNWRESLSLLKGRDQKAANKIWYDFER